MNGIARASPVVSGSGSDFFHTRFRGACMLAIVSPEGKAGFGLCVLCWLLTPFELAAQSAAFTRALQLEHGAFRYPGLPNAVVHGRAPPDPAEPLDLVVFLHGFRGCALAQMSSEPVACAPARSEGRVRAPIAGRKLARVHERASTRTLLVVPQLKLLARDGSPGRFGRAGGFAAFVRELLDHALVDVVGAGGFARLRRIALVAHSAGYQTALAILERGGMAERVRDVVLLDALYAGPRRFEQWLLEAPGRRLISLHAGRGKPARHSRSLARRLRRAGLVSLRFDDALLRGERSSSPRAPFRWAVAEVDTPHARFPQVHMASVLQLLF